MSSLWVAVRLGWLALLLATWAGGEATAKAKATAAAAAEAQRSPSARGSAPVAPVKRSALSEVLAVTWQRAGAAGRPVLSPDPAPTALRPDAVRRGQMGAAPSSLPTRHVQRLTGSRTGQAGPLHGDYTRTKLSLDKGSLRQRAYVNPQISANRKNVSGSTKRTSINSQVNAKLKHTSGSNLSSQPAFRGMQLTKGPLLTRKGLRKLVSRTGTSPTSPEVGPQVTPQLSARVSSQLSPDTWRQYPSQLPPRDNRVGYGDLGSLRDVSSWRAVPNPLGARGSSSLKGSEGDSALAPIQSWTAGAPAELLKLMNSPEESSEVIKALTHYHLVKELLPSSASSAGLLSDREDRCYRVCDRADRASRQTSGDGLKATVTIVLWASLAALSAWSPLAGGRSLLESPPLAEVVCAATADVIGAPSCADLARTYAQLITGLSDAYIYASMEGSEESARNGVGHSQPGRAIREVHWRGAPGAPPHAGEVPSVLTTASDVSRAVPGRGTDAAGGAGSGADTGAQGRAGGRLGLTVRRAARRLWSGVSAAAASVRRTLRRAARRWAARDDGAAPGSAGPGESGLHRDSQDSSADAAEEEPGPTPKLTSPYREKRGYSTDMACSCRGMDRRTGKQLSDVVGKFLSTSFWIPALGLVYLLGISRLSLTTTGPTSSQLDSTTDTNTATNTNNDSDTITSTIMLNITNAPTNTNTNTQTAMDTVTTTNTDSSMVTNTGGATTNTNTNTGG